MAEAMDLLLGVDGAGLGDDAVKGFRWRGGIAADATFGVCRVFVAAPRGDDEGGICLR